MKTKAKINEKLMKKFEKQMTAVQDLERGLPESCIPEYEASRKRLQKTILESHPSIQKALSRLQKVQKEAIDSIEKIDPGFYTYDGQKGKMKEMLALPAVKGEFYPCKQAFEIPFVMGIASDSFGTETPVTDVTRGKIGWDSHSTPPPNITNTGDTGSGKVVGGALTLHWETVVPCDGEFEMQPSCLPIEVFGKHKVLGIGGGVFSNIDALVEVHAWVLAYLDSQWIYSNHTLVSNDLAMFGSRTKYFVKEIDLPERILFQAHEGQALGMQLKLQGITWANYEGRAELDISRFYMVSNGVYDLSIPVFD